MRIGLLSPWASRLGGGVFEAVVAQVQMIAEAGHDPILFALADSFSDADRKRLPGARVIACSTFGPKSIGYAPALIPALLGAELDVLHQHGIWMYPSRAGLVWAKTTGRHYVISPHGMLDPWIVARSRLKKSLARAAYEKSSWASANIFHALTVQEAADIRRETGLNNITVIPNFVHVDVMVDKSRENPYILALGRIHTKKNQIALVDGWLKSNGPAAGWKLIIAGWGQEDDVANLEREIHARNNSSIRFVGPIYGKEKSKLLENSAFFILPSLSEGLPLAILEAWASGTPTIQSEGCNLPEGFDAGVAIRTGTISTEIAGAISRAIDIEPDEYKDMSDAARYLVERKYSHDAVRQQWSQLYKINI